MSDMVHKMCISSDRRSITIRGIECLGHTYDVTLNPGKLHLTARERSGGTVEDYPIEVSDAKELADCIMRLAEHFPADGREKDVCIGYEWGFNLSRAIGKAAESYRSRICETDGRRLREIYLLQQNEDGIIDYDRCRETERQTLSEAGAAYMAFERIWARCEPIESHLPESERSGYSMGPDCDLLFLYLRSRLTPTDSGKIRTAQKESV